MKPTAEMHLQNYVATETGEANKKLEKTLVRLQINSKMFNRNVKNSDFSEVFAKRTVRNHPWSVAYCECGRSYKIVTFLDFLFVTKPRNLLQNENLMRICNYLYSYCMK